MEDDFRWELDAQEEDKQLKYIGGVDISFVKDNDVDACACLIVLSYPDFKVQYSSSPSSYIIKVVYSRMEMVKLTLPYISTFLAFREIPFLVPLINELRTSNPEIFPQIIMVDGNGLLHPRGTVKSSQLDLKNFKDLVLRLTWES